ALGMMQQVERTLFRSGWRWEAMPCSGVYDGVCETPMGFPPQYFVCLFGTRHETRRISWPAGDDDGTGFSVELCLAGGYHFSYRIANAGSKVEHMCPIMPGKIFHRQQMRGAEVFDVDVVADAGTVGRVVVAS